MDADPLKDPIKYKLTDYEVLDSTLGKIADNFTNAAGYGGNTYRLCREYRPAFRG